MSIRSIIVDNHLLFAQGLQALLEHSRFDIGVLGIAKDFAELNYWLEEGGLDLIFLDLNLGKENGLDMVPRIKTMWPQTRILIVSMYDNQKYIKDAFLKGADGYVLKESKLKDLDIAIEAVMNDEVFMGEGVSTATVQSPRKGDQFFDRFDIRIKLTKREIEILQMITDAMSNKEIAQKLFISDQTVSVHRKSIMRKLGVSNTIGLIKRAQELYLTN